VVALFTGGTISMRVDAREGGAVPSLSGEEILAAAHGIERVASVRPEQWGRYPGPHMTVERQWALRNRIAELAADPSVDGLVITHGTDTLEETAYLVGALARRRQAGGVHRRHAARRATSAGTGRRTCSTRCASPQPGGERPARGRRRDGQPGVRRASRTRRRTPTSSTRSRRPGSAR
jgi:hypothetical protein